MKVKATSLWVWAPIMLVMGFVVSLIMGAKPREINAGEFKDEGIALHTSLDTLAKEAQAAPNASSVTVHFKGPHELKEDQSEFWSYNRRLKVLIGFMNVNKGGNVVFSKIVCPIPQESRLAELANMPKLSTSPKSCGCVYENINEIGGQVAQGAKSASPAPPAGVE